MAGKMIYLMSLGNSNGDWGISGRLDPPAFGRYDWAALYSSQADLDKDIQRAGDGDSPDNYETYEYLTTLIAERRQEPNWYWYPDKPTTSGWLLAYWSWDYVNGRYNLLMSTAAY